MARKVNISSTSYRDYLFNRWKRGDTSRSASELRIERFDMALRNLSEFNAYPWCLGYFGRMTDAQKLNWLNNNGHNDVAEDDPCDWLDDLEITLQERADRHLNSVEKRMSNKAWLAREEGSLASLKEAEEHFEDIRKKSEEFSIPVDSPFNPYRATLDQNRQAEMKQKFGRYTHPAEVGLPTDSVLRSLIQPTPKEGRMAKKDISEVIQEHPGSGKDHYWWIGENEEARIDGVELGSLVRSIKRIEDEVKEENPDETELDDDTLGTLLMALPTKFKRALAKTPFSNFDAFEYLSIRRAETIQPVKKLKPHEKLGGILANLEANISPEQLLENLKKLIAEEEKAAVEYLKEKEKANGRDGKDGKSGRIYLTSKADREKLKPKKSKATQEPMEDDGEPAKLPKDGLL